MMLAGTRLWELFRRLSCSGAGASGGLRAAGRRVGGVCHGMGRDGGTHPRDVRR